ncbi:MAG: orotidine-5'-phosphate decarboxylase [Bifidobacteriaceae bacterium]|jgi:orotidine-5'-phosphate decarboxylase|nr:orotidine-5'-phosphate decarboxylase [Bifidobacteriaceae bacterium]
MVLPAPFGQRLADGMARLGPLCVGIDPHAATLAAWDLPDDARGLEIFGLRLVEAAAGTAPAVKPQAAFFERHGAAGLAALERVLAAARAAGLLTILDVKRGDIGSTMAGYAQAYLGEGAPLAADAITVSPYLGFGSLRPAIDLAQAGGKGLFVLALTSNPEGPEVQAAVGPDGLTVAGRILRQLGQLNAGATGLGSFGAVVGATIQPPEGADAAALATMGGPFLAPGIGAQGAGPAQLAAVFGPVRRHVLAASSRAIAAAGPSVAKVRGAIGQAVAELLPALA